MESKPVPWEGVMPKNETEAAVFVNKYPTFDGRGVIVAILDTGVDPGAPGMQVTSDGKKKIIDCIDTTGSGDVDTSTVTKVHDKENNTLLGLSGRTLVLSEEMLASPSFPDAFHLGLKRAYDLFPSSLRKRMQSENKKTWDKGQRTRELELLSKIESVESGFLMAGSAMDKKTQLADLQAQLKELRSMHTSYEDPGPLYDCVVFKGVDGRWRAVVDSTCTGNLGLSKSMTDYKVDYEYSTFSNADKMNYSFNIYEDGNILSIVNTVGAHGTHVGGIVGAYYPGQPELSGIAPGVQLVSIKIGDTRLGSMETSPGLMRALLSTVSSGCDMLNLSYGEATSCANSGRFSDLAKEFIKNNGLIVVSSAGNAGPALSTAGAPGATEEGIIGIGAYVSPQMMTSAHSLRSHGSDVERDGKQYTWSSRGPTPDGALGVCVSACGGAIAPVPNWTLQQNQLMNGTSMSSPCATGGIALLVSACKQQCIPYTPHRIRVSLENTARKVPGVEPWAIGQGLQQVDAAYNWLKHFQEAKYMDVKLEPSFPSRDSARGLYLRSFADLAGPLDVTCSVATVFPGPDTDDAKGIAVLSPSSLASLSSSTSSSSSSSSASVSPETSSAASMVPANGPVDKPVSTSVLRNFTTNDERINFVMKVRLECSSSYVFVPREVLFMHGGRTFAVRVDPTGLPAGPHFTEILGFDVDNEDRGPVLRIPVTTVVPEKVEVQKKSVERGDEDAKGEEVREAPGVDFHFRALSFDAGRMVRKYFFVPQGATWADIHLKAAKVDSSRMFVIHAMYLLPHVNETKTNKEQYFTLAAGDEEVLSMPVVGGVVLEVVVAQFWSSLGPCTVDVSVKFHGLVASCSNGTGDIVFHGSQGYRTLQISSLLRTIAMSPSIKLSSLMKTVRPSSSHLYALPMARNSLPGGRIEHELLLHYEFKTTGDKNKIKPFAPYLCDVLYESSFDGQLWMLFDENKKYIATGDAFPDSCTVGRGKFYLKLHIRHETATLLESLQDMPMTIEHSVKELSLPVYASLENLWAGKTMSGATKLKRGDTRTLFVGLPSGSDWLPAAAEPSDVLAGSLNLGKKGDWGEKNATLPLKLVVPISANSSAKHLKTNPSCATAVVKGTEATNADSKGDPERAQKVEEGSVFNADEEDREMKMSYVKQLAVAAGVAGANKLEWALTTFLEPLFVPFPAYLSLHHLKVTSLYRLLRLHKKAPRDSTDIEKNVRVNLLNACKQMRAYVDADNLAQHYGRLVDTDDSSAVKLRKEKDEIKGQFLRMLTVQALVCMDMHNVASASGDNAGCAQAMGTFEATMKELSSFENMKGKEEQVKYRRLLLFQELCRSQFGDALARVNAAIVSAAGESDKVGSGVEGECDAAAKLPSAELYDSKLVILKKLGWSEWVAYATVWRQIDHPTGFWRLY